MLGKGFECKTLSEEVFHTQRIMTLFVLLPFLKNAYDIILVYVCMEVFHCECFTVSVCFTVRVFSLDMHVRETLQSPNLTVTGGPW